MTSVVVLEAGSPIVSYAEAKAHLRFYGDDEPDEGQAYIKALIATAEAHFGGPNGWLGRSLGLQTLELRICGFGWTAIELPYGPVRSIVSIKYDDADGIEHTADAGSYVLNGAGASQSFLRRASGVSWPSTGDGAESVRIAYTAGYEAAEAPAPLKHAVLLLVSHWYEHRENVAAVQTYDVPATVQALASPFRVWAV